LFIQISRLLAGAAARARRQGNAPAKRPKSFGLRRFFGFSIALQLAAGSFEIKESREKQRSQDDVIRCGQFATSQTMRH
jgi:hypothetical protein